MPDDKIQELILENSDKNAKDQTTVLENLLENTNDKAKEQIKISEMNLELQGKTNEKLEDIKKKLDEPLEIQLEIL